MRLEFKAYLEKKGLPEKYFSYCNRIEDAFKGKDMDEIILTHQNISKVRTQLHTITTNEGSIDNYMVALNHYLKFAFSANKVVIRSSATPKDLVAYEKSVPSSDQISGLIEYIEKEYENIRKFAQAFLPCFLPFAKRSSAKTPSYHFSQAFSKLFLTLRDYNWKRQLRLPHVCVHL